MSVHGNGTGTGWGETLDVAQLTGYDYQEFNDLRIGVRKRLSQQHTTFADNTVGGLHKKGGCSILGFADATTDISADGTYCGFNLVYCQTKESFYCFTQDGTTAGNAYKLNISAYSICRGGDWTWTGAQQFDGSADFTHSCFQGDVSIVGKLVCSSTADFSQRVSCYTGVDITGFLNCASSAYFANDVSCKADLVVDGTFVCTANADFSCDVDISGALNLMKRNLDTTGHTYLPNGTILQWGKHTFAGVATFDYSFNTAETIIFPNTGLAVWVSYDSAGGGATTSPGADPTKTGIYLNHLNGTGAVMRWFALGY